MQKLPASLTPDEAQNFAVALKELPATAQLAHVIAEGSIVILEYVDSDTKGPVVVVATLNFDNLHAISSRSVISNPTANPRNYFDATPPK